MPRGYRMGLLLLGDSPSVPNGSTVTPINDVPTWLQCAGIPTTTYTTLSEVLADTSLLRTLINSENAMDYLVRCKEWTGLDNGLVPIMTSNTTPSGIVSASSYNTSTTRYPYKAFDGDSTSAEGQWMSAPSSAPSGWLNYEFETAVCVRRFSIKPSLAGTGSRVKQFNIQGSNDGFVTYETLFSSQLDNEYDHPTYHTFNIINNTLYKSYRINVLNTWEVGNNVAVAIEEMQYYEYESLTLSESAMQFIGANDYASNLLLSDEDWLEAICNSEYFEEVLTTKVPTMTSATTPSGECFSSALTTSISPSPAYAFDNNTNTLVRFAQNQVNNYIGYKFDNNVSVNKCVIDFRGVNSTTHSTRNFIVQASTDNSTWTDIANNTLNISDYNVPLSTNFAVNNATDYAYYRLLFPDEMYMTGWAVELIQIQFYGRNNGGVQSWLLSAGITNKAYTSLSEVFSDTETLRALLNNHNSVDYLVTVPSWASEFASNENAMKYIGANDYASDILLANEEWCKAIGNSTYSSYVISPQIPKMTSITTPSGVVSLDSTSGNVHSNNYQVFDDNLSTSSYFYNSNGQRGYWQYDFGYITSICTVMEYTSHSGFSCASYKLQGSVDGSNFDDLVNVSSGIADVQQTIRTAFYNYTRYRYYRFSFVPKWYASQGYYYAWVDELQFYGRDKGGVQSWLLSANITNKNYTTLNQVLSDTDTLTALISSHSAMDYLVTCTSWANDICSNQTAMTLIGNDNYASDKLLADETWLNAIINSTYIESVLNVKIPVMTSNTTPSGECIANSSRSQNQPYSCFDSSSSTYWLSSENNTTTDDWLGYDFGKSVKVHYVDLYGHGMTIASSSSSVSCSIKMQAYNGSDWVDITEGTTITSPNGSTQATVPYSSTHLITGNNSYNKYRLLYSSKTTGCRSALYSMQCYGREDV